MNNKYLASINAYPFGMLMSGRNFGSDEYRFGYNGMEMDGEVKGEGASLDFGARIYDSRLGSWLSIDPITSKYPFVSPFAFVNNNPILYIDQDGKEWVNSHTAEVNELTNKLLDNPNDKSLQRQLRQAKINEFRVNQYLKDLQTNDVALYDYIDKLMVVDESGNQKNVKVYVASDPNRISGDNGQTAETTKPMFYTDEPNVKYNDKDIVAPLGKNGIPSFDVKIYGKTTFGDERLANEAGDVMYYMEYNEESINEKGNSEHFKPGSGGKDAYLTAGSSVYSNDVEATYRSRKKDGTGKNSNVNPYPLKKEK